jgi:uncharacterized protein
LKIDAMKKCILSLGFLFHMMLMCYSSQGQNSQTLKTETYTGPIIDMHLHTGLPHKIPEGTPSLCRPAPCEGDVPAIVDPEKLYQHTLEIMDQYHIELAFLSGVNWQDVQQWKKAAPSRFIASPFILEPNQVEYEKLKAKYENGEFQGMGEIGAQLHGIPANHASLNSYYKLAEDQDIPVLIHSAGIGPYLPHFKSAAGLPLMLEDVLVNHPKLRIFVENAGFPYKEEMIAMMYQYPQLYVDVSTITWVIPRRTFYDYLEGLVRAGLVKRIMFGSDQMVWPEKIGAAIEAIQQAPFLTKKQKADIFYNNAVKFLRLEAGKEGVQNRND